jgi:hypothetical protein
VCTRNTAGIYGAVTRTGRLAVGQTILLRAATEKRERGPGRDPVTSLNHTPERTAGQHTLPSSVRH